MLTIIRPEILLTTPPADQWIAGDSSTPPPRESLARLDLDAAETLKCGPHRRVLRYADWILKISPRRGLLRSRARREAGRLRSAHEAGLPVPIPIAWAVTPTHDWLVLERLDGNDAALEARDPRRRRLLAPLIGQAVCTLHQAGWQHRDLHLENLWIRDGRIWWLDASALKRTSRRPDLAALLAALPPTWSRTDRWRVTLAYFGDRETARRHATRLAPALRRARLRIWKRRARRCLRRNRSFTPIQSGLMTGWARVERPATVRSWIERVEERLDDPRLETLKSGRTTAVFALSQPPLILKRYHRDGGTIRQLLGRLTPTRGRRAWLRTEALAVRHLPVARAWAYVESPRGRRRRSWIFTERLAADGLDVAWHRSNRAERLALIDTTARLVATLHRRGVSCRDLKAANLLVRWDGSRPILAIVDPDGVREHRFGPSARRCRRDLVRLDASFAPGEATSGDRLRWWLAYTRRLGLPGRRHDLRLLRRATRRKWRRWAKESLVAPGKAFRPPRGAV